MSKLRIVVPRVSNEAISDAMRCITRAIGERLPDAVAHGFLGGSDGYGADWTGSAFDMRPYYWGDCTCGADEAEPERPHSKACALELPNFLHRKSGLEVRWYKYIGRGMEVKNAKSVDLTAILMECLEDVRR